MSTCTYEHSDCNNGSNVDDEGYGVNVDVGNHNQDPQYNMFLNNVKQEGQSYALVVSQKNDVSSLLRYEIVGLVGDEADDCGAETPDAIESYLVDQNIKEERILQSLSDGVKTEVPFCVGNFSSEGDGWSTRTLRDHVRNNIKREIPEASDDELSKREKICSAGRNSGRKYCKRSGLEGNYLDEYEIGREADVHDVLSGKRKSCLARRRAGKCRRDPKSDGMRVRYGTESKQSVESEFNHDDDSEEGYTRFINSGYWKTSGEFGSEGNFLYQRISDHEDVIDEEYAQFLYASCGKASEELGLDDNFPDQGIGDHEDDVHEKYVQFLDSGFCLTSGGSYIRPGSKVNNLKQRQSVRVRKDHFTNLHLAKHLSDHENKIDESDEYYRLVNAVCGGTKGQFNRRRCLEHSRLVECECDQVDFSDDIDEKYITLLDQLEKDGEATMYDDSLKRFNEVEEMESDEEIIVMDEDPYDGATTPFVSTKQFEHIDWENYCLAEDPSISCSRYKKGLMKALKMPYDSKEHEDLKERVSCRKPVLQERDTKSISVKEKLGKSLLDLHDDFKKQLDQVNNDDLKSLNLLRGFFYWLEKITHGKGFKPWLDPSCLEVLPQKLTRRTQGIVRSKRKRVRRV